MKTKLINKVLQFILYLITVTPFYLEAQVTSNPVESKRNRIAQSIEGADAELKESIIQHLLVENQEFKESTGNYILMVWEQELIDLINGEYEKLLDNILTHEEAYYQERNNRTFLIGYRFNNTPHGQAELMMGDSLNRALLNYLYFNRTKYELKITNSDLRNEESTFLVFYLRLSIFYNGKCQDHTQEMMGDAARNFMERHPNSIYADIVKKYGSYKSYQSNWTMGASLSLLGIGLPLSREGGTHVGTLINAFHVGLSASYSNFFLQASGGFTGMNINDPENVYQDYYLNGAPGGTLTFTVGYNFHNSDYSHTISPFVGITGSAFSASIMKPGYDSVKHDYEEYKVDGVTFRNRAPIIGFSIDINSISRTMRCNGKDLASRQFHRIQLGVSPSAFPMGAKLIETTHLFFSWSIGIESERERRVANF